MKKILTAFAICLLGAAAPAAEISGTVRSVSGDIVTIATEGDLSPNVNDKAEIFFKLSGSEEKISVATGRVLKIEGDSVQVKIENATGEIAKDQLARISSDAPPPRSEPALATPGHAGPVADNISSNASAESIAASLHGKWFGQKLIRGNTVIVKSDGSVVVPLTKPGASLSGRYLIDPAATPPRIEVSDFKWVPPPNLSDEEIAVFHQETKEIESAFKIFDGTVIGEIDSPTRVRAKLFTKEQAAAKPKVEGDGVHIFNKGEWGAVPTPSDAYKKLSAEASARLQKKDYDGAIAAHTKLLELEPDNVGTLANRATLYQLKGDWAKALDDLNRHISHNPMNGYAYRERAGVRIRMSEWSPEVLEDCNKALVLEPHDAEAYLFRGGYFQTMGDLEAAEADYTKAVSLNLRLEPSVREMKAGNFGKEKKPEHRKR